MVSRLKARKPARGKATAARSRRNDPRGGTRASVATRLSSRMNPRGASSRRGRGGPRRLTEELEAIEEHQPELEHQVGMDLAGSYDEDFADVAGDTFEREKGLAIESSVQALLTQVGGALAPMAA